MIILTNSSLDAAKQTIKRLGEAADESAVLKQLKPGPWFSYGMAEFDPSDNAMEDGETEDIAEFLIGKADGEMYVQKRFHGKEREL